MDVQNNGKQIIAPTFQKNAELSNDIRKFFALKGEHKRKWTAENADNHIGICLKIDGALITTQQNKCDGGLLLDDNRLYLVEFKGKAYKDAVNQLIETVEFFKTNSNYSGYDFIFHARIVGKSFPRASTELQKAKVDLRNYFGEKKYQLYEQEGNETI
ncbi:MAG: hypothetical protein IKJ98_08930 [Bacteroidales bacterium]|nr:hypothetical protein [Bacteroidales bacterium]